MHDLFAVMEAALLELLRTSLTELRDGVVEAVPIRSDR